MSSNKENENEKVMKIIIPMKGQWYLQNKK